MERAKYQKVPTIPGKVSDQLIGIQMLISSNNADEQINWNVAKAVVIEP
jgi:hypothetical protein